MNQTLIALLCYLGLCAGIGYSRGLQREILVLGVSVSVLAIVVLVQNQVHSLLWTNLSADSRSLPVWSELLPGADWPTIRRQLQESPLSLLVWLLACGAAYWFSQTKVQKGKNPRHLWGAVASICSGTLYLIMVPLLGRNLLWPTFDLPQVQSAEITVRATELLNTVMANRATVLTILAIAILIYLISRRQQSSS